MNSEQPDVRLAANQPSQPGEEISMVPNSAFKERSESSYYASFMSYQSEGLDDGIPFDKSAGWTADGKPPKGNVAIAHNFYKSSSMQEKENELPRAATTQPATIINRPISSIIPRIGLQRRDGASIGKPSVQQVPILFLNDDEPTLTTSPTDNYKLEIECTNKRCENNRKLVSRLQVENTRFEAQNKRLAGDLAEARADSIHYQRAFQMQEKDIQKLKVQINDIKESLAPGTLVQPAPSDDTVWRFGDVAVKPVYQLGKGTYGLVLCAINLSNRWALGQEVAIKIMDKQFISSFHREQAYLLALGGHEITPMLLAVAKTDKTAALVMTKCSAALSDRISASVSPGLSEETCKFLIHELIILVSEMHRHGYIHFDIKPHNILFTSDGRMQLCDGGMSCRIKDISKLKTLMRGTEGYMSPEVFNGDNIRHPIAVDMYCVGITLAQMRKVNFPKGLTTPEQMEALVEKAFPQPAYTTANSFLNELLSPDPSRRLSAKDALVHPWIRDCITEPESMDWLLKLKLERRSVDFAIDIGPFTEIQYY